MFILKDIREQGCSLVVFDSFYLRYTKQKLSMRRIIPWV